MRIRKEHLWYAFLFAMIVLILLFGLKKKSYAFETGLDVKSLANHILEHSEKIDESGNFTEKILVKGITYRIDISSKSATFSVSFDSSIVSGSFSNSRRVGSAPAGVPLQFQNECDTYFDSNQNTFFEFSSNNSLTRDAATSKCNIHLSNIASYFNFHSGKKRPKYICTLVFLFLLLFFIFISISY